MAAVEAELLVEPRASRDERALRVLLFLVCRRRDEEARERCVELGARVGLAVRRAIKVGTVEQAMHAGPD